MRIHIDINKKEEDCFQVIVIIRRTYNEEKRKNIFKKV